MYNRIYRRFCSVDIVMLLCAFTLSAISLYSLYILSTGNTGGRLTEGVTGRTALIQAVSVLIGLIVFITVVALGQGVIKKLSPAAFAVSLGLCILTLTPLGITVDDDRAWLGIGGISVQPSELLKIGFIMTGAYILSSGRSKRLRYTLFCLAAALGAAVIFLQRDMGTLLIFTLVAICMLFCSGVSKRLWALGILLSPAIFYGVWSSILNADQKARILSGIDPALDPYGTGYQQLSAHSAIANGGFTGRLFEQKGSLIYVSSAHNDFILSFIAQLFGSVGLFAVCLLLCMVIVRAAPKSGSGSYIYYVRSGVFMLFASQGLINTAMNLSLFPVIGITLPFVSAGGTSAIAAFTALGLVSLSGSELQVAAS
ncbi:MAG: FtsW/RodA/SpoVE family cell cycle protein [Ruminococcus sp.]|nr:FtsW/RodA/SpoVE family cell cycle protein [Ruminococcus sp.]